MYCGTKILTLTSFFFGAVSVGTVSLSVATDFWLYMIEPGSHKVNNLTESVPVTTHSGLWKVCTTSQTGVYSNGRRCSPVPLSSADDDDGETGRIDGPETSMAILRNNRSFVLFPVISLIMMVFATILGIIGNLQETINTLFAAITYIVGGLLLAVGIILYISAINDEVGHRMKTTKDNQDSEDIVVFRYWYGWSFYFAGTAFITGMLTAVVLVTLYLKRNAKQEDMIQIIPGLEDVLDSENTSSLGAANPAVVL